MFFGLGFAPCFLVTWVIKQAGLLRIPARVELAGLDADIVAREAADVEELLAAERVAVESQE